MTTINLPEKPKEDHFEDFISAFLQTDGYFIQRNVIDRETIDILELDVIATDYEDAYPTELLYELKSGKWGHGDLFKIRGWMDYIDRFKKGYLIVCKDREYIEEIEEKAEELSIGLGVISDPTDIDDVYSMIGDQQNYSSHDIKLWRFSYWTQRKMLKRLKHKKKCQKDVKAFKALDDYYFQINSEVFFPENVLEKLDRLYGLYSKYKNCSAKLGKELKGKDFRGNYSKVPPEIYKETYYDCNYTDIQLSTYIEHKARLAVFKNAVDYQLYKDYGDGGKTKNGTKLKVKFGDGNTVEQKYSDSIPSSLMKGIREISEDKYFHKYPVFWQWFLWLFGGFILKDFQEQEYELLSKKTGIPEEEIPNALGAYNKLFPRKSGWFLDLDHSNIKRIRLFPVPLMGIGANYRRLMYTDSEEFDDLNVSGRYTKRDLIRWNNLTVEVLNKNT